MQCKLSAPIKVSWTSEPVYSILDMDECSLIMGVMTIAQCKRWIKKNGYTLVRG